LLANFTQIPGGDRLQVIITSQPPRNFHATLASTPPELDNLAGGVYTIARSPEAASFVNPPLTSPEEFTTSPTNWGPPS
jgi:hypothetical protein